MVVETSPAGIVPETITWPEAVVSVAVSEAATADVTASSVMFSERSVSEVASHAMLPVYVPFTAKVARNDRSEFVTYMTPELGSKTIVFVPGSVPPPEAATVMVTVSEYSV